MIIKKGVTRIVFVFKNFVIKIPNFSKQHNHFLQGCYANWNERYYCKWWNKHGLDHVELIAQSYFCTWFGLIQIQERVKIKDPFDYLTEEEVNHFKDVTSDIKPINFGWNKKGVLVCVDYI